MTLFALAGEFAARGERIALRIVHGTGVESWTYARLSSAIDALAGALRPAAAAPPAIALCAPNAPEWVAAYFAIIRSGGSVVAIDFSATDDEACRLLNAAGCRLCARRPRCSGA